MRELILARDVATHYLAALFGSAPSAGLVEVRFRVASGMHQRFFPVGRSLTVVDTVLALATRTDVFVGVLPRVRRRGRLEDIVERGEVVWADCDTQVSAAALRRFEPRPSMVVASGSGQHRHAYWMLREPVDLGSIAALNRRLAVALGADAGVVTKPHTILRPPGSLNWKHRPPAPVRLLVVRDHPRIRAEDLDSHLPREAEQLDSDARAPRERRRVTRIDSLHTVPPPVYFERLTGVRVGGTGKVRCPFHHEDRTPSLHVYEDPDRGWYCFGCGRGGSIYDLASLVLGRGTRGREFIHLRRELEELVL